MRYPFSVLWDGKGRDGVEGGTQAPKRCATPAISMHILLIPASILSTYSNQYDLQLMRCHGYGRNIWDHLFAAFSRSAVSSLHLASCSLPPSQRATTPIGKISSVGVVSALCAPPYQRPSSCTANANANANCTVQYAKQNRNMQRSSAVTASCPHPVECEPQHPNDAGMSEPHHSQVLSDKALKHSQRIPHELREPLAPSYRLT